jgi:AcrR family transcriptional regulator
MVMQVSAPSKQQERAQRILNAAAELILRWGYDKTTMDDISQKAGVPKGTLYLHWKSREAVFEALLRRESLALRADFRQQVIDDPAGATLRGIYKHAALALIKRPLLMAVLLNNQEILGRMARAEQNRAAYDRRLSGFHIYLDFLRQHDLLRADLSLQAQAYAVSAIFTGFFTVAPLMPEEVKPSDEEIAELIGETIHRTFETGREVPSEEMHSLSTAFLEYIDRMMHESEIRLQNQLNA